MAWWEAGLITYLVAMLALSAWYVYWDHHNGRG